MLQPLFQLFAGVLLVVVPKALDAQSSVKGDSLSPTLEIIGTDTIYWKTEGLPGFSGGQAGLLAYLATNIEYPAAARKIGADGQVVVQFVIDPSGQVKYAMIAKPALEVKLDVVLTKKDQKTMEVYRLLDEEALRVVRNMVGWTPGTVKGKLVHTALRLPISFGLKND
ncbi:energy transducer TonB [Haliscomenobacter sp.]|uniref:energy transducer TonB n=1 Tax=Haliscomenobacter sp. TaxID=2717303 RepID=UPI0035945527